MSTSYRALLKLIFVFIITILITWCGASWGYSGKITSITLYSKKLFRHSISVSLLFMALQGWMKQSRYIWIKILITLCGWFSIGRAVNILQQILELILTTCKALRLEKLILILFHDLYRCVSHPNFQLKDNLTQLKMKKWKVPLVTLSMTNTECRYQKRGECRILLNF